MFREQMKSGFSPMTLLFCHEKIFPVVDWDGGRKGGKEREEEREEKGYGGRF